MSERREREEGREGGREGRTENGWRVRGEGGKEGGGRGAWQPPKLEKERTCAATNIKNVCWNTQ
jgi:hypothetical protein